ncbi:MAG: hypothetical protein LBE22_11105, partial [Azoarcus sp.]|nr:hypothetical protein [Azoarcus sp.]
MCICLARVCHRSKLPHLFQVPHHVFARDPYMIAYLRGEAAASILSGGRYNTVKIAVMTLAARDLLEIFEMQHEALVRRSTDIAVDLVHYPIEKAVLDSTATWEEFSAISDRSKVQSVLNVYEDKLRQENLLISRATYIQRLLMFILTLFISTGGCLIYLRSLPHTFFTFFLLNIVSACSTIAALLIYFTRSGATAEGKATLTWLHEQFADLKQMANEIKFDKNRKNQTEEQIVTALREMIKSDKSIKQTQDIVLLSALFYPHIKESNSGGGG